MIQFYSKSNNGTVWNLRHPETELMRIPDHATKSVVFLCTKQTVNGIDKFTPGGTAFFVSIPFTTNPSQSYIYLVTAAHNIKESRPYGDLYLRINTKDNKSEYYHIDEDDWIMPPEGNSADVAIKLVGPPSSTFDYRHTHYELFATEEVLRTKQIGIGDDIIMIGLHHSRSGYGKNMPIVRSGIISCMPDDDEPFYTKDDPPRPFQAYLTEVRSIGGLSGSPVFVMLGSGRLTDKELDHKLHKGFLIGLVRGHYESPLPVVKDGKWGLENFNEGIAMITPIQEVIKLLYSAELMKSRSDFENTEKRRIAMETTTEDSAFGSAYDKSVLTQTDFTDALKLASCKTSAPDQETKET